MNIFAFDDDVRLSALWLDDIRKNKMISETNQLLASAMDAVQPNNNVFKCGYPKSVPSHGCAVWARAASDNFNWLLRYNAALLLQWGNNHAGYYKLMAADKWFYSGGQGQFPEIYMTPFYNGTTNKAQGLSFKHIFNTNAAYRLYIRERWNRDTIKLTWDKGEKPWWK